jgi:hypothetical protein
MAGENEMDQAIDWHLMLLGLAGRISDDVLSQCRGWLAEQRYDEIGPRLLASVVDQGIHLFEVELDFLAEVPGLSEGLEPGAAQLEQVTIAEAGVPLAYGFAATLPDEFAATAQRQADEADAAAVDATAAAGARGLWRAWRLPTEGAPMQQARRVYVIEADEDADLTSIMGTVQRALARAGEADPQVEVYPTGSDLPSYQRFARAYGELIWSRTPDPEVRIAVLFDEVDPEAGPRFRPDHPKVDDEELPKLVEYLRRGEALLLTTARLDDVVDQSRGNAVPMSFRTDGTWVWSDATTYYLEVHRLLPDPELAAHIRAANHVPPMVDDVARHRAMAALREPVTGEPAWTFGG